MLGRRFRAVPSGATWLILVMFDRRPLHENTAGLLSQHHSKKSSQWIPEIHCPPVCSQLGLPEQNSLDLFSKLGSYHASKRTAKIPKGQSTK